MKDQSCISSMYLLLQLLQGNFMRKSCWNWWSKVQNRRHLCLSQWFLQLLRTPDRMEIMILTSTVTMKKVSLKQNLHANYSSYLWITPGAEEISEESMICYLLRLKDTAVDHVVCILHGVLTQWPRRCSGKWNFISKLLFSYSSSFPTDLTL